eukprot:TRINITY_DN2867_c0_g1_i1.p1 TRINITY_DN2867_c0_g1~~TRINITY_DN2867_c0_g1_i1.p1  ORF type:complete len:638 (-),score=116.18 TRINITY_DN2867_c0_g1_i1:288-2201(-)
METKEAELINPADALFGQEMVPHSYVPDDEEGCATRTGWSMLHAVQRFLFLGKWLRKYSRTKLRADAAAGLTVGTLVVPQAMAYGTLAGLSPVYGLYASLVPLCVYALLGSSGQMAVGPTAIHAMIVAEYVDSTRDHFPEGMSAFQVAIVLSLLSGLLRILMGLAGMGFIATFLSSSVISGFTSAAGIMIMLSQLRGLTGLPMQRGRTFVQSAMYLGEALPKAQVATLLTLVISLIVVTFLVLGRRVKRLPQWFPFQLIAMAVCILVSWGARLDRHGVQITGDIPRGFPPFSVPRFSLTSYFLEPTLVITCIAFMESISIGKKFARERKYEIDASQELLALGCCNVAGSFFSGFPVTGSFSRSAIAAACGSETPLANAFAAAIVAFCLAVMTPLFFYLPRACLAAIIVASVYRLVEYRQALWLWRSRMDDRWVWLATFLATLGLGVGTGVLIGVFVSFAVLIKGNARPGTAVLGRVCDAAGAEDYRDITRFAEAKEINGVLVWRFDSRLVFANSDFFRDSLERLLHQCVAMDREVKYIVVDCRGVNNIDSSAVAMLEDFVEALQKRGITLVLAQLKGPLRDLFDRLYPNREKAKVRVYRDTTVAIAKCVEIQKGVPQVFGHQEDGGKSDLDVMQRLL